jgi:mRNA-degrading endonuclease RelE of RelBE toxin-antitoxin system
VKQLGLSRPGFRPEGLGEVERCDLLADELRDHAPSREPLLALLRKGLKEPAFATSSLDPEAAEELLEVAGSDHGLAIALWRLLCDPRPEVRQRGAAALERLAVEWYGPPPEGGEPVAAAPASGRGSAAGADDGAKRIRGLEEQVARTETRLEEQRQRADAQREKLQVQLKEARAEAARAVAEAARGREVAEAARAAQASAETALAFARSSDASAEAARLRSALREAEVKLHAAEAQAARAGEREQALSTALQAAEARAATLAGETGATSPEAAQDEPEEAPASWLLPVFTQEFYDSLAGWDRRIQRAAFKQAFLLSQDWRHPSLRALALEGLPGYYRVRVATDVRLIYRRGERQDTVEVCSLIDREDLDRYVRQAKTR